MLMVMHQEYLKIVLHWPVWLYNMRFQEEAQGIEKSRCRKIYEKRKKKIAWVWDPYFLFRHSLGITKMSKWKYSMCIRSWWEILIFLIHLLKNARNLPKKCHFKYLVFIWCWLKVLDIKSKIKLCILVIQIQ